jgi:hypothetical protein
MKMKLAERRSALIAGLLLAGIAASPIAAAAAEPSLWTVRGRALVSDYENRYTTAYFDYRTELDVDQGRGLELAVEVRPNPRVGAELAIGEMRFDAAVRTIRTVPTSTPGVYRETITFSDDGDFVLKPISFSLLFHLFRDRPVDLYLGPQVSWVQFDVGVEAQEHEAEPAYGAKLGGEMRLGDSPWSLGLELRHIETIHDRLDRDLYGNIGLDAAALSLAYHFGPPVRR